jgi:ketosteroid isomerase-like protein
MPHPNTTLLREAYDAFATGDLGPLLAALTDDITWRDSTLAPWPPTTPAKTRSSACSGR